MIDSSTITKKVQIKARPQRVIAALSEPGELERWFVQKTMFSHGPDLALQFEWAPGMAETGKLPGFRPPYHLSYSWEAFEPSPTAVGFALSEEDGGTRHNGIGRGADWDAYYKNISHSWNAHLTNLVACLDRDRHVQTPRPKRVPRNSRKERGNKHGIQNHFKR